MKHFKQSTSVLFVPVYFVFCARVCARVCLLSVLCHHLMSCFIAVATATRQPTFNKATKNNKATTITAINIKNDDDVLHCDILFHRCWQIHLVFCCIDLSAAASYLCVLLFLKPPPPLLYSSNFLYEYFYISS